MAINKNYRDFGYFSGAKTNAQKVIDSLKRKIKRLDQYGERLLEQVCILFVEKARQRLLDSGYDVKKLLKNIWYRKYGNGKYRVGIRNNNEKEIMYFLEFGTGIVGMRDPHPKANDIGWEYLVNPEILASNSGYIPDLMPSGINSLGEYVGYDGWYYLDPKTNQLQFTSGLHAVSYLYDTMKLDMPDIIKQAKEMVKIDD